VIITLLRVAELWSCGLFFENATESSAAASTSGVGGSGTASEKMSTHVPCKVHQKQKMHDCMVVYC
jgi:hypothetical protein